MNSQILGILYTHGHNLGGNYGGQWQKQVHREVLKS